MIIITNNVNGRDEVKLTVSRNAYETFYKRLGYSIVNDKKTLGVSSFEDIPKVESKESNSLSENFEDKKVVNKRKNISND